MIGLVASHITAPFGSPQVHSKPVLRLSCAVSRRTSKSPVLLKSAPRHPSINGSVARHSLAGVDLEISKWATIRVTAKETFRIICATAGASAHPTFSPVGVIWSAGAPASATERFTLQANRALKGGSAKVSSSSASHSLCSLARGVQVRNTLLDEPYKRFVLQVLHL